LAGFGTFQKPVARVVDRFSDGPGRGGQAGGLAQDRQESADLPGIEFQTRVEQNPLVFFQNRPANKEPTFSVQRQRHNPFSPLGLRSPRNSSWLTPRRWCPERGRSFAADSSNWSGAFAADCGDDAIDLTRRKLVGPALPGRSIHGRQFLGRWRKGLHVVLEAHDDDAGLAPAANQETLVLLRGPRDDLPKLGACG
jgi:hypothetical protein